MSRVVSIAQHLKSKHIRLNSNVYSCLAFAFKNLIATTKDIEPLVSQKSISYIETLSELALKSIIMCFELQFSSVIVDRIIILQTLISLHSTLYNTKTSTVLTWEFFANCFGMLSIEAQLSFDDLVNDCLMPIDQSVSVNNANFQHQIKTAKFALLQTKYIRSISKQSETTTLSNDISETNSTNSKKNKCLTTCIRNLM